MAEKEAFIYLLEDKLQVFPPVLPDKGGNTIKFINATTINVSVTLPKGAGASTEPTFLSPGARKLVKTKEQGSGEIQQYQYKVEQAIGIPPKPKKHAQKLLIVRLVGGSDPILILEN
jgi:hypothetical protein